jgi:hypothetical protein
MTRHGLAIALAATLALAAAVQPVGATSVTPISRLDWAPNQELPFRWREDGTPPAWMRTAIQAAAQDSTASRGARAGVLIQRDGAVSWVAYTAELPDASALAFASRRVPDSFKIWLRPQGYVFDWGNLRWCQFYAKPPDGCIDAEMVALHEFGHVHGLGHIEDAPDPGDWLDSIMHTISRGKPKVGWDAHAYGRCDVAALQTRYELLTPATRVSSCLSLATDLAFGASASTIISGSTVTFTAVLRIADDVAYSRLASDPLVGRSVLLQRRLPGASQWTTHATMLDSTAAGSYRLTVAPTTAYEWRARLNQPDEGLLAASSAMLKVTVTAAGCNPYCVE